MSLNIRRREADIAERIVFAAPAQRLQLGGGAIVVPSMRLRSSPIP